MNFKLTLPLKLKTSLTGILLLSLLVLGQNVFSQVRGERTHTRPTESGGSNTETRSSTQDARTARNQGLSDRDNASKEINSKYEAFIGPLRYVKDFLKTSSGDRFGDFVNGLKDLESQGVTLKSIGEMVNNGEEEAKAQELGGMPARYEVKNKLYPGIQAALSKTGDSNSNLDQMDEKLKQANEDAKNAKIGDANASAYAAKVQEYYEGMVLFSKFTNNDATADSYRQKAEALNNSVKSELNAKFAQYREGQYHKDHGASLAVVSKNGVTTSSISDGATTEKILIDGKTPTHIFVFFDLPAQTYAGRGAGDLTLVETGKDYTDISYVLDKSATLVWKDNQKAAIKFTLFPSADFSDFDYVPSGIYQSGFYDRLAGSLPVGETRKFTLYALDGKLKKDVTVEMTSSGKEYLLSLQKKMDAYRAESMRMSKPGMSDPALEAEIGKLYQAKNPDAKQIVRVVIPAKQWFIEKNALDVPLNKNIGAEIAFKDANGNCFWKGIGVLRDYQGNGNYASQIRLSDNRWSPSPMNCANVNK
ncbi:MAG: hypothetical protein H6581_07445 [Bacteroidia bacterium]|nr:hypothetical protein [Bacteroidia bacterium]